ncbi:MAG TPA: hypothetical protein VGA98_11075 [Allosphingosinicella sp.]|jgi:hypothetical protein
MKLAFTLFLVALMILPAVAVAGYRFRRALRERDSARSEGGEPR